MPSVPRIGPVAESAAWTIPGMPCGMQIVVGATVISEDKALALLSGCQVTVAAKGGRWQLCKNTTPLPSPAGRRES